MVYKDNLVLGQGAIVKGNSELSERKTFMVKKILPSLIILLLLACSGCSSAGLLENRSTEETQVDSAGYFTITLTRDFGEQVLDTREVQVQSSWSLMEYMQREYQVTTGFGGSFITGLNGVESAAGEEGNSDWFFFVNGAVAMVGADRLKPAPGDVVWWDYHRWSDAASPTAVIGCYPQPFVNRKVIILANPAYQEMAEYCRRALNAQGAGQVTVDKLSKESTRLDKPEAPVIVIGTWPELQKNSYIADWNRAFRRNGSGIHFTDNGVELLSFDGEAVKALGEGTGVIVASSTGQQDNPMWLVAGVDEQGVKEAVWILCLQPEALRWKYGLAVQKGQITALPAE